jgi:NADH dehydrogenase/NADH:ubiquinone oxidoreductase subunit G
MCLIEDGKSLKPIIACSMHLEAGDTFYTETLKVRKAREGVMEFLLINHPLDCPICDQGGECDLQDISFVYGSDKGRFYEYKRAITLKKFNIFIKMLMTRCIHCTRCVRFFEEFRTDQTLILGVVGRGLFMEVGTYFNQLQSSELLSNIIDICPVGALTSQLYSFHARSWELLFYYTFDLLTLAINPIKVFFKNNVVYRILPCNSIVLTSFLFSTEWLLDSTRYSYDSIRINRFLYPSIYYNKIYYKYTLTRIFSIIQVFYVKILTHFFLNYCFAFLNLFFISPDLSLDVAYYLRKLSLKFLFQPFQTICMGLTLSANTYLKSLLTLSLKTTNALLFLGFNPRLQLPYSVLFFKQFLNQESRSILYYLGPFSLFTTNIVRLGACSNYMHWLLNGRH